MKGKKDVLEQLQSRCCVVLLFRYSCIEGHTLEPAKIDVQCYSVNLGSFECS